MDATMAVTDAMQHLGLSVRPVTGPADQGVDLVVDVGGTLTLIEVKRRALVDDAAAARLLSGPVSPGTAVVVVGDRVTRAARGRLAARGVGYLDLRGHLALRTPQLIIDTDLPLGPGRLPGPADALAGTAGLEIAVLVLMSPGEPIAVRSVAREVARAPSTVSGVLRALRDDGLVRGRELVDAPRLFWRVAERWGTPSTLVAHCPERDDEAMARALRLGLADVSTGPGWALTDTLAAAALGAPVAHRSDAPPDFLVPDDGVLRRALTLLGPAASADTAGARLRVPPVGTAVSRRLDMSSAQAGAQMWPVAHPLLIALDLAQDLGRGRDVLASWTPAGFDRVW